MQNFARRCWHVTAFVAASIAIGQYDIKRCEAYLTVLVVLGFMAAAVGMGAYGPVPPADTWCRCCSWLRAR